MSFYGTINIKNTDLYITDDLTFKNVSTPVIFKFELKLNTRLFCKPSYSLINDKGEYLCGERNFQLFSDGRRYNKLYIGIMDEFIFIERPFTDELLFLAAFIDNKIKFNDTYKTNFIINKVNYIEEMYEKYMNDEIEDYNIKYNNGDTILHYVSEYEEDFDVINYALVRTDLRIKNDDGDIFLFKLIENGMFDEIKVTENYDATYKFLNELPRYLFNVKNKKGNNLLMEAIDNDKFYKNYFIYHEFTDYLDLQNNFGNTFLHLFCKTHYDPHYGEIDYKYFSNLIERIIDMNITNHQLETPFNIICKKNPLIVNLFLSYYIKNPNRIDINTVNQKGHSCIFNFYNEYGKQLKYSKILEKFLNCLPNFNFLNNNTKNTTLLMKMIEYDDQRDNLFDIVINNSNIDILNNNAENALIYALKNNNEKIIVKLLSSGIYINYYSDIKYFDNNLDYTNLIKDIYKNEPKNIIIEERQKFRVPYIERYNKGFYNIEYMRKETIRRNKEITENAYKNYKESEEYSDEEILEPVFDILEQKFVEKSEFLKDENNIIFHIENKMIGLSRIFFNPIPDDKILLDCEGIGFNKLIFKKHPIQYVNLEAYGVLHPNDEKIGILVKENNLIETLSRGNEFKLEISDPIIIIESATSLEYYKNPNEVISRLHCQGDYTGIVYNILIYSHL
jgi:hypothetical protein